MNNIDLSVPTRQSVRGLVLIFLFSLRRFIQAFWPVVILALVKNNFLDQNKVLILFGVFAVVILLAVHTILYFLNFYFYIDNEEFILKKGYLRKKVLAVPLDRIQSVNTKQNLIQQALNVVSLEIDTAGSIGKELKIQALELSFAKELQNHLRPEKKKSKLMETTEENVFKEKRDQLILTLSPVDLLKIGISQNHLRTALIVIAFGGQLFQQFQDLFKDKSEEYSNEVMSFMSNSGWALITFMVIFFLLVSILISLFRTL